MGSGKILYHLGTTDGRASRTVGAAGAKVCTMCGAPAEDCPDRHGMKAVLIDVGTFLGVAQSHVAIFYMSHFRSLPSFQCGDYTCSSIFNGMFLRCELRTLTVRDTWRFVTHDAEPEIKTPNRNRPTGIELHKRPLEGPGGTFEAGGKPMGSSQYHEMSRYCDKSRWPLTPSWPTSHAGG
jgi:hypothetical protein